MEFIEAINNVLWADVVLYIVLGVGLLFTIWSGFSQYYALTHGVAVIRGKFDSKDDPGAINHFQALSAALSATVGLGNIAGVAMAVSIGGPGAVFWMWVVGFVGMALKTTEVSLAMLYRNTDDASEPHGGAMWVVWKGLAKKGATAGKIGWGIGAVFCVTLLVSAFTGGNMFQAWNVADISHSYFGVPQILTGIILTLVVGAVILGGIKRIGTVAGRIVPFMCAAYLLAGIYVIVTNIGQIPGLLGLIFRSAFSPTEAAGAFLGGTFGWAFLKGMQRALFSSEAGQGSAPIAHSAAKTDEPVREGIVAGLEPFIDTICVCTVTALVILITGVWNRGPDMDLGAAPVFTQVEPGRWTMEPTPVKAHILEDAVEGQVVYAVVETSELDEQRQTKRQRLSGDLHVAADGSASVTWLTVSSSAPPTLAEQGVYASYKGATLTARAYDIEVPGLGKWLVPFAAWLFAVSTMISWSYYGEQGIVFLFGGRGVIIYRVVYCLLILVSTSGLVRTEAELDTLSALGTGVMLAANIPIMLFFGSETMTALRDYLRRLRAGEMHGHAYPKMTEVVDGTDV